MADGVIPSKQAWDKVSEAVKEVLGEPTQAQGERRGLVLNRNVLVYVTGAISGQQGRYNAKVLVQAKPGTVGPLALSDFGTQQGDATVWYPPDIGQTSPTLDFASNPVYGGDLIGWDGAKAVVVVTAGAADCTSGDSTSLDVVTGVTWNAGGNGKLQYTKATLTIDGCGNASYSAPVTVDIDTPGACA